MSLQSNRFLASLGVFNSISDLFRLGVSFYFSKILEHLLLRSESLLFFEQAVQLTQT